MTRTDSIIAAETARAAEIETLADHYRADTGWSVVFAVLFGPFYFAVWGFWGQAAITLIITLLLPPAGWIYGGVMCRKAWRARAMKQAERAYILSGATHDR